MSQEINDLEVRLKALLSKVEKLLKHPPAKDSEAKPEPIPPPLLLQAPTPVKPHPTESAVNVLPSSPEIIPLPATAPRVSVTKSIPAKEENPPLLLRAPVVEKTPEPPPLAPTPRSVNPPPSDDLEVPFLIVYPESLSKEAQDFKFNLESLKPKFTKMKFHLRSRGSIAYSAKESLLESTFAELRKMRGGALLIITKHRLSYKSPHPIVEEMSRLGIYFQEIMADSIPKKSFYFDFLLGLVFFLKSQLPPSPRAALAPETRPSGESIEWNGLRRRE